MSCDTPPQLMTASSDSPHTWEQYYQPEPGVSPSCCSLISSSLSAPQTVLQDMEVYEMGVVMYALRGGAPLVIALLPGEDDPLVLVSQ